jgi:hypothetical protein
MNREDLIVALAHVACAALAASLIAWNKRCEKVVEQTEGKTILRYVWSYRIMALLVVVLIIPFEIVVLIMLIVQPPKETEQWVYWTAVGMLTVMPLIALYAGLDSLKSYAIVSEEGIEKYSPWWGRVALGWEDIATADMYASGAVRIRTWSRKRLSFPNYWKGRTFLIEELQRRGIPCRIEAGTTSPL